jgi:hypothetical protein
MPNPIYLHTLAHVVTLAETSVSEVQRILDEIGARPTFIINLSPLYDAAVAGTVLAKVKGWTNLAAYHATYFGEVRADG